MPQGWTGRGLCAASVEALQGDSVVALGTLVVHLQPLGK